MIGKARQNDTLTTDSGRTIDVGAGRRAFMKTLGVSAAGAALLGLGLPGEAQAAVTDADILNFALNLEYLEAEFYLRAATGSGLPAGDVTGTGKLGSVKGGRQVKFTSSLIQGYAQEIASDEFNHVKFLRSALAGAKVARPAINLVDSFQAAADAAGVKGTNVATGGYNPPPPAKFDAFANEDNFLLAAFLFEDVGVTAYKGAAALISNKDVLTAAAGLLAVEAYHAGEIRTLLASKGYYTQVEKFSDLRDAVDGSADLDQGIGSPSEPNIVPADANGLAFSRTPAQVLQIVYLGGSANHYGFFPSRFNGTVR